MSVAKMVVGLILLAVAFKGCSMAKEASTRRAEQGVKQQAVDPALEAVRAAQRLEPPAGQPDPYAALQKRADDMNASNRMAIERLREQKIAPMIDSTKVIQINPEHTKRLQRFGDSLRRRP